VNLRDLARDQPCQVRLPGVCNGNPRTTVLAHVRLVGITGIGLKAPDILGAHCCSDCHDAVDRRTRPKHLTKEALDLALYEGVARTINKLIQQGNLKIEVTPS